jgi:dihydrofolate synthase/folylpolyglutamate synthase
LPGGGTKWSLGPTRRLLDALGHPESHFQAVHVGGTNGKGSVAAMVYEALRETGRRVGLYTSPHLVDLRERIVVDGRPVSGDAFSSWTERLLPAIEETDASFFEATTAVAFADFAARGAEIAVIEVGLGGRLDSTNVITPLVSAVTNVGMDHTEYLGDTIEAIATEKAGIAKQGVPFVMGETDPAVADTLEHVATSHGATVVRVGPEAAYTGALAMEGAHQRRNAATSQALLAQLPASLRPSVDQLQRGFARAWLPGRLDRRGKWLFDVAHNVHGIDSLVKSLGVGTSPRPMHALVAVMSGKDVEAMLGRLQTVVDRIWITDPPSAPAWRRQDPHRVLAGEASGVEIETDFDRALQRVQRGAKTVVVTGSFHTVGDAMARLPGFRPLG